MKFKEAIREARQRALVSELIDMCVDSGTLFQAVVTREGIGIGDSDITFVAGVSLVENEEEGKRIADERREDTNRVQEILIKKLRKGEDDGQHN